MNVPKCSHLLFNFSFIIYSILENTYLQNEKESLKNPPTLPFSVHCLMSDCPAGISYCISAVFLKCKTCKPKLIFLPHTLIHSSHHRLWYQWCHHTLSTASSRLPNNPSFLHHLCVMGKSATESCQSPNDLSLEFMLSFLSFLSLPNSRSSPDI